MSRPAIRDGVVDRLVVQSVFDAVGLAAGWDWPSSARVAELRTKLGLPAEGYGPGEWTAGQLRAAVAVVADGLGVAVEMFTAAVLESLAALRAESEGLLRDREAEEAEVAGRMAAARSRALAARALPAEGVLDKVIRQEGHLGRQLDLTLRQLERLKAARRPGGAVAAATVGLGLTRPAVGSFRGWRSVTCPPSPGWPSPTPSWSSARRFWYMAAEAGHQGDRYAERELPGGSPRDTRPVPDWQNPRFRRHRSFAGVSGTAGSNRVYLPRLLSVLFRCQSLFRRSLCIL